MILWPIYVYFIRRFQIVVKNLDITQEQPAKLAFTCLKLTTETLEQSVNYVQS